MARPNNSEILGDADWQYLAKEIAKDYPHLTLGELYHIINMAIKGKFEEKQVPINAKTIYKWLDEGKVYCFSYWYNRREQEKKAIDYLLQHFYTKEELILVAAKGAAYYGYSALLNLYVDASLYQWHGRIEEKRREKIPVANAINHLLKKSQLVI